MIQKIVLILIFTITCSFALADNHQLLSKKAEFNKAVKYVEQQKFSEALGIFKSLATEGLPEAQFNLSLLYFNGVGAPTSYRLALYWSWYAFLNQHENATDRVNTIKSEITEKLQNTVAQTIIDELLIQANQGNELAPLKLGQTYLRLFVQPSYKEAYLWLSIAQAYGEVAASELLSEATGQLTLEEVLVQQDLAQSTFQNILSN